MNLRYLTCFFFILFSRISNAQNYFTLGDNGTFEIAGSENAFVYDSHTYGNRNDFIKFQGQYSLKLWALSRNATFYSNNFSSSNQIQFGKKYFVRMRVYVPSSDQTGTPLPVGTKIKIGLFSNDLSNNTLISVDNNVCTGKVFEVGIDPYNQWVDIYNIATISNVGVDGYVLGINSNMSDLGGGGIFLVDGIEIKDFTPISFEFQDDAWLNDGDLIITNITGGLEGIPYTFEWNDGVTTKNRYDVYPGNYTLVISQLGFSICNKATWVLTNLPPPKPISIDLQPVFCEGQTTRIQMSPLYLQGATLQWYTTQWQQIGETPFFVGNIFEEVQHPGLYTYYVQSVYNGFSSSRTKVSYRVGNPDPDLHFNSIVIDRKPLVITNRSHLFGYHYSYFFQYGEGDDLIGETVATDQSILSYTFEDKGSGYPALGHHNCSVTVTDVNGCSSYYEFDVEVKDIEPLCEVTIPLVATTDNFSLDKFSGRFVTRRNCDVDISLGCIQAKPQAPQLTNVVSASATTFSDQWDYTYLSPQSGNDYENGQRGKWRPQASYAFNVPIDYQSKPENHRAGTFSLSHFNWQYPAASTKSGWLKTNTIERYTPNGDPVQERNALNIASVAKFGYGGSVPYLIAQNAEYEQLMFESFENAYMLGNRQDQLEDGVDIFSAGSRTNTEAHSGSWSLQLAGAFSSRAIPTAGRPVQVRFWMKGDISALLVSPSAGSTIPEGVKKVAASGAWTLYEAIVVPGSSQSVTVTFVKQAGGTVWLDDVRLQPVDAAMTCYVYEPGTLRLLTVFDDQHFGLYYQYNDEGKLVRKQVETERGLKTIQETQYNLPQQAKDNP